MDRNLMGGAPHEPDDQLELYALDRLTGTDLIRVEEHLFVCEHCRTQLEKTAAFAYTIQDVLKLHPEPDQMAFSWHFQDRLLAFKQSLMQSACCTSDLMVQLWLLKIINRSE